MFSLDYQGLYNEKLERKVKVKKVYDKFKYFIDNNSYALFKTMSKENVKEILSTSEYVKKHFTDMIVVGIGGSSLGTQALLNALEGKQNSVKVHILDNVDCDYVKSFLSKIDLTKTCFNFVSKSGKTVEVLSILQIVKNLLRTKTNIKKQVIITTTNQKSPLMDWAEEYKVKKLFMQSEIVGRFSGLSAVGLFPCAVVGIDIEKILEGANSVLSTLLNPVSENEVLKFSILQTYMMKKGKFDLTILPYANKLESMFIYYAQTLAESLGKVENCPSATVMVGANFQHSFFEQVLQGRDFRYTMLVKLEEFNNDYSLGENEILNSSCKNLSDIIKAECIATLQTLQKHNRPSFLMSVEKIDEESVGKLFTFMQMTICCTGLILGIDAFSQPSVEELKKNIHALIK